MKRKFLSGLCAVTALTCVLTGCGGSASNSTYDSAYSDNDYYEESYDVDANYGTESYGEGVYKSAGDLVETALNTTTSSKDTADSSAEVAQEAPVSGEESVETGTEETGTEETTVETEAEDTSTQRKLITTMNIDAETYDLDAMMDSVEKKVSELGGYIEESSISMNTNSYSYYYNDGEKYYVANTASLTIRVPDDKLQNFVESVEAQSNITYSSSSSEDVTLQYVDTESRKAMYLAQQESLLALLEKAETVEDIAYLTEQLAQVRYNIESMESQLRTYDNLVDYATVDLDISEVEVYTPVAPVEQTTWERITTGFKASMDDVISGLKNFFINLLINAPYILRTLIILAIIVGIIWIIVLIIKAIIKKMIKKFKAKAEAKKAAQANAPKANPQPNKTLAQAPAQAPAQAQAPIQAQAQDDEKKEEAK